MHPRVAIILLNWNNKEDTLDCIRSLKCIGYPNFEIIVADNGSTDDSVKVIKGSYPEITLIENRKNLGFAAGNNAGIRPALLNNADYILLLNNDTVVDPKFLDELIRVAESDPKIGVVGPKIYYYSEPGRIWFAGGRVNYWLGETGHVGNLEPDEGQYDKVSDTDFITGCALLIKRKVLDEVGLLNETMGFYFEDNDLCARIKRRGYRVVYVPTSLVWHKVASAASKIKDFQLYYFTRNRLIFMRRNSDALHLAVFLPYYLMKYVIVKLVIALVQLKFSQARLILKAFYEGAML